MSGRSPSAGVKIAARSLIGAPSGGPGGTTYCAGADSASVASKTVIATPK